MHNFILALPRNRWPEVVEFVSSCIIYASRRSSTRTKCLPNILGYTILNLLKTDARATTGDTEFRVTWCVHFRDALPGFHKRRRKSMEHLLFLRSIPPHLGSARHLFLFDIPVLTFDQFARRVFIINLSRF